MNTILQCDVTNVLMSHDNDVTLHVIFTVHHRPSQTTIEKRATLVVDPHAVQERTPLAEMQCLAVSQIAHVQPERLKLLERPNVEPLQEVISLRERDVLELVAQGLSNREIAQVLVLSVDTVKRHMSNIFSKLNVHSRIQAVVQARSLGMLVEVVDSRFS